MTSPYVTFPKQPQPLSRPSAWPVLRVILSVAIVIGCGFAYLIAGFIAVVTWTGCFIDCSGANHPAGAALALLAVALLAAGPAVVSLLYRSRVWLWVGAALAAAGAVLIALLIGAN